MMSVARTIPCLLAALAVLTAGGCSRTLVFAERDGVNMAIRADAARSPPLEVNFGLNRVVGTSVPPIAEKPGSGGVTEPRGQAVNMISGFQVLSAKIDPKKPADVDLTIRSHFASGSAAEAIAEDLAAVQGIATFMNSGPGAGLFRPADPRGQGAEARPCRGRIPHARADPPGRPRCLAG